jgi:hypothetical protein
MKNSRKLIQANMFALLAVVTILTAVKWLGIDIGSSSGSILPKMLLVLIPQAGFVYYYMKSYKKTNKRVTV